MEVIYMEIELQLVNLGLNFLCVGLKVPLYDF